MTANGSNSLAHFVEALEEVEQEKRAVAETERNLLAEAAQAGLHRQALKDAVRRKLETTEERSSRLAKEEAQKQRTDALGDYLSQLGLLSDPPPKQPTTKPRARA